MTRAIIAMLGALFAPLIITAVYLSLSRWPERWFTSASDNIAIGLAVLVGIVSLWSLSLKAWHRLIGLMLYAPFMWALLHLLSLAFVCSMFRDCL
jgi:hypothetical protein